jgi:FlaA1/EpsC-like NDP-sugar epimerase
MSRKFDLYTRTNQLVFDGLVFALSFALAYLIRFEGMPPWWSSKQFLLWLPYLVALRLWVNWKLGIYKFIWRYVSLPDAVVIARSTFLITAFLLLVRFLYPGHLILARWARIPLGVIALECLMSLTGSLGARALRRILYERGNKGVTTRLGSRKRVILYGAGRAGILLLKELLNHGDFEVVGFVDDDAKKVGAVIMGTKVLGDGDALAALARRLKIDEAIISIASATRTTLAGIVAKCDAVPLPTKIIPSLQEIIEGHVSISQIREVRIEDLLGRSSVEMSGFDDDVRRAYAGKRILVTGGGGSIGSELVRQLLLLGPESIAILDKDENSVYELEQELRFSYPGACVEPLIVDIRNDERLLAHFSEFKPQVVFHAAAHKHVPLMEKHPCEAVLNNVFGTRTLLDVCRRSRVERFIFISTDKAVNPVNVMGATKRLGEMLVQASALDGSLPSACVRFGNVLGSRGSVIPLFQKQIAEGGPITVTHPDVVRFFMTIPEAVQLVLCAGTMGAQGEVFVLDMGDARNILELAREMARLAGLEPDKDIEIRITGLRPGEKLFEELVESNETTCPTRFDKLTMVVPRPLDRSMFFDNVNRLVRTAQRNDRAGVRSLLAGMGFACQRKLDKPLGIDIEGWGSVVASEPEFGPLDAGSVPEAEDPSLPAGLPRLAPNGQDRRRVSRRTLSLPGRISLQDGREDPMQTENLSNLGVCFVCGQILREGESLKLSLGDPRKSIEAGVAGRVVWRRPLDGVDKALYGVCLEEKFELAALPSGQP